MTNCLFHLTFSMGTQLGFLMNIYLFTRFSFDAKMQFKISLQQTILHKQNKMIRRS